MSTIQFQGELINQATIVNTNGLMWSFKNLDTYWDIVFHAYIMMFLVQTFPIEIFLSPIPIPLYCMLPPPRPCISYWPALGPLVLCRLTYLRGLGGLLTINGQPV